VGRPSASVHVWALLLTALLAWPWDVVFSVAESFQVAGQIRHGALYAPGGSPRVRCVVHCGGWDRSGCAVIAQDYDRDGGEDDDGPLSPSTALWLFQAPPSESTSISLSATPVLCIGTPAVEYLCRLRC
jgi:hypothetical protein